MKPINTRYSAIEPYRTKDGSEIRELMHPSIHGNRRTSLAEAKVPPGGRTFRHVHEQSEEIYHFTAGSGRMELGEGVIEVVPGDTVCILPGMVHCLENTSNEEMRVLCVCTPAYAHEDTQLVPRTKFFHE
jgi:mannose-6-phosphate isomerase-like protein (cupin superfamily)